MTLPDDPHPRKHNIINERIGIVGGGIIGLAVARRVLQLRPDARLTLLEKESAVATHQTSHNSGVAHAGVYYTPGSLKAQLCRRGIAMLKDYCAERQLPYEECGKIVVATTDAEVAVLRDLEARARANGVPALRWLSASALHEIEPHAVGKAALHSPSTAIVDYAAIAAALRDEIERGGAAVCLHHNVTQLSQGRQGVTLSFRAAEDLQFDRLILSPAYILIVSHAWPETHPGRPLSPSEASTTGSSPTRSSSFEDSYTPSQTRGIPSWGST